MFKFIVLVAAVSGCTYPEKESTVECRFDTPTTDKQTATINGVVRDAQNKTPLQDATVTLLSDVLFAIEGPEPGGADGSYDFTLPLNGSAFPRMYVRAEASDHVPTLVANGAAVIDNLTLETDIVSSANLPGIAMATTGAASLTAGTGTIFLKVKDCDGELVSNATLTTDSDNRVFYFNAAPSNIPKATTDSGVAMITDITASSITVTVHVGGVTYRPQTYRIEPDAITQADITP